MTPIDWNDVYHVGIVVPELDTAMADLGAALGLTWPTPQTRRRTFRGPDGAFEAELRFVYSVEGPPHLELIEQVPGTPWETGPGIHHVGVWVDHLAEAAARLTDRGVPVEVTYDTPELQSFTYHRLPGGLRVELVDRTRRSGIETWLGGG